jgi:hypothetical protein
VSDGVVGMANVEPVVPLEVTVEELLALLALEEELAPAELEEALELEEPVVAVVLLLWANADGIATREESARRPNNTIELTSFEFDRIRIIVGELVRYIIYI